MVLILFFTLILNVVAIALTYYCLSNLEKKEKVIFIAVGIAVIYVLTSAVYWFSTKDIVLKQVSEIGKNLITFLFVPINAIVILPIFAKSYNKYKIGRLALGYLRNRAIVLSIILLIILLIECSYFKDIQNSVVTLIEKSRTSTTQEKTNTIVNDVDVNIILYNEISNIIQNGINEVE